MPSSSRRPARLPAPAAPDFPVATRPIAKFPEDSRSFAHPQNRQNTGCPPLRLRNPAQITENQTVNKLTK
jgi:hypothetical protein